MQETNLVSTIILSRYLRNKSTFKRKIKYLVMWFFWITEFSYLFSFLFFLHFIKICLFKETRCNAWGTLASPNLHYKSKTEVLRFRIGNREPTAD